ncbi:hypothetical protein LS68_004070 [Helicobacter sp. MIT 05-5293]|uniref:hypothetical protein n=1 Tax=Helicobacter sp. MIT 05-5293 TaxID=1548149 RepID=UPI00051D5603|nr:hypothetical protein [Helicobacter sp. MIT 05-5293]TLD82177.1 hypothetical protein LS68_004070 [Helicobacter sp. MIT 05-5293]
MRKVGIVAFSASILVLLSACSSVVGIAGMVSDTKIGENAKKYAPNCKDFYIKNKIVYKGYNDVDVDESTEQVILRKEKVLNQLREFDAKKNEKLSTFNYKWAETSKENNHFYCKVILENGLSRSEKKAFAEETLKFDPK